MSSLNNDRVIYLVPREVLDSLECDCPESVAQLVKAKKIPHMYIWESENYFIVEIDRVCSCACENRYEQFKMEKDKLRQFLITQNKVCKTVHDTEWY